MLHSGNTLSKEPSSTVLSKRMATAKELAAYLSVPKQRIYMLTHTHAVPFHKIGRSVFFNLREIDEWLDAHRVPMAERGISPKREA